MTDPLDRVLNAVNALHSENMDPGALDAWGEAKTALHEARERYAALVAVAHQAQDLVDILDRYEEALEDGDKDLIALLSAAGSEVEDRLVDALNGVVPVLQEEPDLSEDLAHLAVLDRFADEVGENENDGEGPRR